MLSFFEERLVSHFDDYSKKTIEIIPLLNANTINKMAAITLTYHVSYEIGSSISLQLFTNGYSSIHLIVIHAHNDSEKSKDEPARNFPSSKDISLLLESDS